MAKLSDKPLEKNKAVQKSVKLFVYFISFWWKQGGLTGMACYEQPMVEPVKGIAQLMHSAQLYAKQLHDAQMAQRKEIPITRFWEKFKISTKPFLIYPLDYKLLREDIQKIEAPKKDPISVEDVNRTEVN